MTKRTKSLLDARHIWHPPTDAQLEVVQIRLAKAPKPEISPACPYIAGPGYCRTCGGYHA